MNDKFIDKIDANGLNGSDLAYVGDAFYELFVRNYLLSKGVTKPEELHKLCVKYVSATAHSQIFNAIKDNLTLEELNVFNRGKNYNYRHHSKNTNTKDYLTSSGFEAIIGYLYLKRENERLDEILMMALNIIENK